MHVYERTAAAYLLLCTMLAMDARRDSGRPSLQLSSCNTQFSLTTRWPGCPLHVAHFSGTIIVHDRPEISSHLIAGMAVPGTRARRWVRGRHHRSGIPPLDRPLGIRLPPMRDGRVQELLVDHAQRLSPRQHSAAVRRPEKRTTTTLPMRSRPTPSSSRRSRRTRRERPRLQVLGQRDVAGTNDGRDDKALRQP